MALRDNQRRKRAPRKPYERRPKFHAPYKTPRRYLNGTERKKYREELYAAIMQTEAVVLCFVCDEPVSEADATLEHITPIALGGEDHPDNFAISHSACNMRRGAQMNRSLQHARRKYFKPSR